MSSESVEQQCQRVSQIFSERFGQSPALAAVAPGRVNLIGEHTDYNDGFVLPMAIERQTMLAAAPRIDASIQLASTAFEQTVTLPWGEQAGRLTPGEPSWANYVKGVIVGCVARGLFSDQALLQGVDILIDSTVPTGGGLSSSAALEVATATLLEAMAGQTLEPVDKALLCQEAEHTFAGVPCGIMDQFISVMGQADHALLIDCRSHGTQPVPLDDPAWSVLIANTCVKHALVDGEYGLRRKQCEQAAKALNVAALRDATLEQLETHREQMEDTVYRRAYHVITENQRTLEAAQAMQSHDWQQVGLLMNQSHDSLRDDYEVSCKELDLMVSLAQSRVDSGEVLGARMTGGGFGGSIVALVCTASLPTFSNWLAKQYHAQTNIEPMLFHSRPAQGARVLECVSTEGASH